MDLSFNGQRLLITLPNENRVGRVRWVSIWCETFGQSFGEITIPTDIAIPN